MLQTVYYIPPEIAGIPVFGFGLLLAVWILGSLGLLLWLGRRQGFTADTWAYVPLLVMVGAIIAWLLPLLSKSQGLPIRGYGVMVVLAVVAGTGLSAWRARRVGLDPDLIVTLVFWMFVPGIIGARAFYVIEYWPEKFRFIYQENGLGATLGAVINLTEGGLVVYGSFIGAMLGVAAFTRRYRAPLLALADLIAPGIVLGLAVGRIGCLLNGCCYGGLCELPWAVTFPGDSPVHFHQVEHGQTFIHGLKIAADSQGQPIIGEVELGSAAQLHGLKSGQQITMINDWEVKTIKGATGALLSAGKISIATEGSRDAVGWIIEPPPSDRPPSDGPSHDDPQYVRDVTDGRAFIHGLKIAGNAKGQPVVEDIQPGSLARRHGLKPGQRIIAINGHPVDTVAGAAVALLDASKISLATREGGEFVQWRVDPRSSHGRPVLPVHPTQIYSAINALLLCLLLLVYDRFRRRDGELFALMLTLYPITRFLLEVIRTDEAAVFGSGLSISQNVSLALLVFAAGLWIYVLRRPPGKAFRSS